MELAYTGALSKYYEDYASNANADKNEYITEENLQEELTGVGTISNFSKDTTTKVITLTYASNGKNESYDMKILADGSVIMYKDPIDYGNKTKATIELGDDIVIGETEKFKVFSVSNEEI